ncbi:hypothetical protein [Nocardia sp. NPDC057353]|uniref:hypothetical protein n=1 Tax=Nocardia sp. NPDC057353 TaxID=3346104 RepID=UPI003634D8C7
MSAHHEIFATADGAGVPAAIERVIGVDGRVEGSSGGEVHYTVGFDNAFVDVALSHDYDDDQGIEFSGFPLVLTVRDRESSQQQEEATARRIFQALRATGLFHAFLVYNLQQKLDQF